MTQDSDFTTPVEWDVHPDEPEVVDGLPVFSDDDTVARPDAPGALIPSRQVAALAATGFVAGAATVAIVQRHRGKVAGRRGKKKNRMLLGEVVTSNSFLVDVHLLRRD